MRFRLLLKSMAEPTRKISMKIDPYSQRRCCSAMTVVSGNIRFKWILAEVTWRRGVKRQWGNRKRRFSRLSYATSSAPQEMRPTLLYSII